MIEPAALSFQIEAWTREAVARWGEDWSAISAYIERRMTALAPEERRRLDAEAALTLASGEDGVAH